ncbi:uncharacterized protein LAESUDRAFT_729671 [Laetiporus sulphureus 93-53]|uniref:RRM domain-containing protein n=1 Tax=Laetiporus sulphureus 93-53 TaxID=1314785 RepID=A0A165CIY3_9APHY|nr:uncharacterized protein LAESUDRAFT_729671 [Laetiporus sulphureus 93-53]KZT02895.1 hypothetical protein LAESUDRAFT_729671 [Laetiporus sulphureus 93-53]
MAPKKAQKMSLNEFLGDSALGSWADEMDALPTAPAARNEGDLGRPSDRRRDDYLSSRSDRAPSFREDLPLPTEPPFTAFIGNLAFDLTESELEDFFVGMHTKSVKIIRDRDEKPKGFGYIEFADLQGLKDALEKSGSNLAGRVIRVSVAEPPKEGFRGGHGGFDDEKFAGNWRREGPLPPDLSSSREGPHRRYEGPSGREPPPTSVSDTASDWRSSSRGPVRSSTASSFESEAGEQGFRRRSNFREGPVTSADTEEKWTIGGKFKPSVSEGPGSRFGSMRGRGDMGPPRDVPNPPEESDWRRPRAISRNSTSPSNSTPSTPQMSRRKLELLPRSSGSSAVPSPLASPNPSAAAPSTHKPNPFGAAKPVDVSGREAAVEERLEKEREQFKERASHSMSRTSSRTASQRERDHPGMRPVHPASSVASPASPTSDTHKSPVTLAANVRPSFSFASAAAGKKDAAGDSTAENGAHEETEKIDEVKI